MLKKVFQKTAAPEGVPIYADKGYAGKPNNQVLSAFGYKNKILRKGARNRKLSAEDRAYNKCIGGIRYRVEQVFGSIKRWFGGGLCRYKGLKNTHFQHVLEAIAYNLYRLNGLLNPKVDS